MQYPIGGVLNTSLRVSKTVMVLLVPAQSVAQNVFIKNKPSGVAWQYDKY